MEKRHPRTPELVYPLHSNVRVGADRGRSKLNNCVPGHPPVCWLLRCAHGHATPMWIAGRQGGAPSATGGDCVVDATIPWAPSSSSMSERCCRYLQQIITFVSNTLKGEPGYKLIDAKHNAVRHWQGKYLIHDIRLSILSKVRY